MPDFAEFVAITDTLAEEQSLSVESVAEFLKYNANEIRSGLSDAVQGICRVGRALIAVKESEFVPHGTYIQWLQENFMSSERTAQRYMSVARMIDSIDPDVPINAEPTALYALARRNTPEEARTIALNQMRDGAFLTSAIVSGIVREIDESAKRTYLAALASPEVAELAQRIPLEPGVIPILDRLRETNPSEFEEIAASGAIEDVNGNQLPLDQANERDVEDLYRHIRWETHMATLAIAQAHDAAVYNDVLVVAGTSDLLFDQEDVFSSDNGPTVAGIWCRTSDDLSRIKDAVSEKGGRALMVVVGFNDPQIRYRNTERQSANYFDGDIPEWLMEMLNNMV